jgi:DNA-binding GntR family transcriptional regulator
MTVEVPQIPPKGVLARDRIAVELRNAIIHGRLQPGERLVEDRIMAWLEATRGATREAFRQLEHEGLVISYPHRGAVVVGVTEDEVHGVLIPIRLVLEQFGFRMALEVGTTADLAELASYVWMMEQAAAAGDIDGIVQADVEFHEAVLHIAPQFHTIHIWRSIAPRIRAYFYRHFRERDLDSVVAEHRELLDALHDGDEQLLLEALHRHIVVPRLPPEGASPEPAGLTRTKKSGSTTRKRPGDRRSAHDVDEGRPA